MSDGYSYVPSEGHITTYRYLFAKERKKPLNYQIKQNLPLLNSQICLEFLSSRGNFNLLREFLKWLHVQSAVHVTTRVIWQKFTNYNIFS